MSHHAQPAGDEADAALELIERCFTEFRDRTPVSLARWRAQTVERSDFKPEDLLVIRQGDRIVAAAFLICVDEVWVDSLAVDPAFRRQGLARELITAARDRAFREGFPQVRLATDSNTGALEVYQHLGMTLDRSFTHWAIDLN